MLVLLFYLFIFWLCSMQDLSSWTRDRTHVPCSGSMESYPLHCQGIPTVIILNKLLSLRLIKNKKNEILYFIFTFPSALSLCRAKFLTHIIFFLSEKILFTFLVRQVYFIRLRTSLSLLHLWKIILQGTEFWLVGLFFFFVNFKYSLHFLLVCMVSEEKRDVILIFIPL